MCIARYVQSIQNNDLAISLQYINENVTDEVNFLPAGTYQRFLQIDTIILGVCVCVCQDMPKLLKILTLLFLCNILRKNRVMKLIFCMQISMKVSYKLIG